MTPLRSGYSRRLLRCEGTAGKLGRCRRFSHWLLFQHISLHLLMKRYEQKTTASTALSSVTTEVESPDQISTMLVQSKVRLSDAKDARNRHQRSQPMKTLTACKPSVSEAKLSILFADSPRKSKSQPAPPPTNLRRGSRLRLAVALSAPFQPRGRFVALESCL